MTAISQRVLRNDSGEVMRRVQAGESFTVTLRGVPVADLVPHREQAAQRPARFAPAEQIVQALRDLPPWGVVAFEEEQGRLDARIDDTCRDPWPS